MVRPFGVDDAVGSGQTLRDAMDAAAASLVRHLKAAEADFAAIIPLLAPLDAKDLHRGTVARLEISLD